MSTNRKSKTASKPEQKPAVTTVPKKARAAARPGAEANAETKTKTKAKVKAKAKAKAKGKAAVPADDAQIAALAYEIWQRAGCPDGLSDDHWREAEARLRNSGG
jgi:hypothetical protein